MDSYWLACGREARRRGAKAVPRSSPNAPASSPTSRPQSVRGPRTIDVGRVRQESAYIAQKHSPFFARLPVEIRLKIHSLVLPSHRRLWVRPVSKSGVPDQADGTAPTTIFDHFPCATPPSDTAWLLEPNVGCCFQTRIDFFSWAEVNGTQPHAPSLALMQTCQQMYLETCRIWTFCFDSLKTLSAFTSVAGRLPVRHLQVFLYAHPKLYQDRSTADEGTSARWQRQINAGWELALGQVDALCRRFPELGTLLLTVHPVPRFARLENKAAVAESLKMVTAAPRLRFEFPGRW